MNEQKQQDVSEGIDGTSALTAGLGVVAEKKPRLFYWEDAEDAWCPAEGLEAECIVSTDLLDDGEIIAIRFRRIDMTDAEFENMPEC